MVIMMRLIDKTIADFSGLLACKTPTPGGGSTAALEAALGISLITMVAAITADKDGYACRREELRHIAGEAEGIRRNLLVLVDEDTAAYKGIMTVRSMPKDTEEQNQTYCEAMQESLKAAVLTPYRILNAALDGLRLAKEISAEYYPHTASDLGLAVQSMKTAAQGAELTVLINLGSIRDDIFRRQYLSAGRSLLDEAVSIAEDVYAAIRTGLMNRI
ncbi:MAG: cyclodeaminase/cyclohydrolase family protein [Treponema sp.]|nr:cyclodeaminase/cyclohydrolase family protein [Treponema sp.]